MTAAAPVLEVPKIRPYAEARDLAMWGGVAAAAFHLAFLLPLASLCMPVYLYALVRLTGASTPRRAFYAALLTSLACFVPHLLFFWHIFGRAAVALWMIAAIWPAFFVLLARSLRDLPGWLWACSLPLTWMGFEYFRSECYWLRFSWLTPGFATGNDQVARLLVSSVGVYGTAFVYMAGVAALLSMRRGVRPALAAVLVGWLLVWVFMPTRGAAFDADRDARPAVGIQLEGPTLREVIVALDRAIKKYPQAGLLVLPEYTITSPPGEELTDWCRQHERWLLIGGTQPTPQAWADTAFVIDPTGRVVFSQGKAVPIQFMQDGVPATGQRLWDSPWGKFGVCICYDLSYTRVTDELARQGAECLIVPAMDIRPWGAYEHALHARVAPLRALEYHIPVLRVASSGISQFATMSHEQHTGFPGQGDLLAPRMLRTAGMTSAVIPLDRFAAPWCVGITGALVAGVAAQAAIRKWSRRRKKQAANS